MSVESVQPVILVLESLSETVRIFKHARSKIPMEVMIEHTDSFDWTEMTKVADIADICVIGGRLPWDYKVLSKRTDITPKMILQTLEEDWDWVILSTNPAITPDLVLQTLYKNWSWSSRSWGMCGLSSNPSIIPELVLQTLYKDWCWFSLSSNPAITPELVLQTLNNGWSWGMHGLSSNPAITPKLVFSTWKKPWSEDTKVWAFINMSLVKKTLTFTQWVHATYAPGSKRAVEIIKNLELMNRR